jgi:uncharacterized protein YggE
MSNTTRSFTTFAACAAALLLASGTPAALGGEELTRSTTMSIADPVTPVVTATGTATVSRSPDQAVVTLGVATVGKTSTEAQEKLNSTMDKIVKAVKGLSLPDIKVQTQWLSLSPVYEQVDYREQQSRPREPKIIGYNASNTVRITVGDINKVGSIIDTAIDAGANQVQGLSFELKDDRDARQEAMSAAARDAKGKVEAIASALGLRVVRIVEAQSGPGVRPIPMYRMAGRAAMAAPEALATPTTVEPGEVTVQEQVTLTVEVQPV